LLLGFITAIAATSGGHTIRRCAKVYTTTIRGLPELLTLFIIYHGVSLVLNNLWQWWEPSNSYVELSPFVAGCVALGMVFGAYCSEVIRGAWQAICRGQTEAGKAIGLNTWQVFWHIELPQILRLSLPGLGNLWINLLKDTALVSIIALDDLMRMANIAVGATKKPFIFFFAICVMYWLICVISEWVISRLEKHANRGMHKISG
jgi:polar amino acid transport system permease protein